MKTKFLALYKEFKENADVLDLQYGIPNMNWEPTTGQAYLYFRLVPGFAERASLGVKHHRVVAIVNIEVGVPLGNGEAVAYGHADTVAGWFRDQKISGIVCRSPEIVNLGQVGDWHKIVVSVPVYWDETYS